MNLNKVFLVGRLTRDPRLKYTPQGTAVADLGLAVNRTFTDGSGQRREETCFVDVVLWQKQADTVAKYLRKGSPVFIEGRLSYETWEGKDGERRSRLKVVADNFQFMDSQKDRRPGEGESVAEKEGAGGVASESVPEPSVAEDAGDQQASDIPF
jgi:single-strand DNA-binding protein